MESNNAKLLAEKKQLEQLVQEWEKKAKALEQDKNEAETANKKLNKKLDDEKER